MSRPEPVRFLRSEPTMAYPEGRLLALPGHGLYVLAPDGWARVRAEPPTGAINLSRAEAEAWCARQGWERRVLDELPANS